MSESAELFSVACCRRVSELLPDDLCRDALRVAESFADGNASADQRRKAHTTVVAVKRSLRTGKEHSAVLAVVNATSGGSFKLIAESAANAALEAVDDGPEHIVGPKWNAERIWQVNVLRDIFGVLYFGQKHDPLWVSSEVTQLARAIYEDSDSLLFDNRKMNLVAKTLRAAGYTNTTVLDHFDQSPVHVRGCWVIDLLLGKK